MSAMHRLALVGLACALSAPANAQLIEHKDLSAAMAITIAQTAIETCKANGYKVSATVVGRNGEIIVQVRGDGTGPHTFENSFRKAYTARTFRQSSGDFAKRLTQGPMHCWGTDPFARGSYSYAKPGQVKCRALLATPVDGRIFFAGEACSTHDFSTAHGAYLTGVAAAETALAVRR